MFVETWEPTRSESGNDQWWTADRNSTYADTMRLTSDLALVEDETYRELATAYRLDHALFDSEFAAAWYKLVHRSEDHPHEDDLEKDAGICTQFEFVSTNSGADGSSMISGAHGSIPAGEWLLIAFFGVALLLD